MIPEELKPYVRVSRTNGLIHRSDMPDELLELFKETKAKFDRPTLHKEDSKWDWGETKHHRRKP